MVFPKENCFWTGAGPGGGNAPAKVFSKNLKKTVDKPKPVWYDSQALEREGTKRREAGRPKSRGKPELLGRWTLKIKQREEGKDL